MAAQSRTAWRAGVARGRGVSSDGEYFSSGTFHARRYFDLDPTTLLRRHPALVELVASPRLAPLLQSTVGDDFQASLIQPRVLPPQALDTAGAEGGYVPWHRDGLMGSEFRTGSRGWDRERGLPLNVKVIVYLSDATVGAGCTYCVPGSHRSAGGPAGDAYLGRGGGTTHDPTHSHDRRPQHEMPGCVPVVARAGSAFAFDTRLHHTTEANTSANERWSITTRYGPFFEKQSGPAVEAAEALEKDGALSSALRLQVFGVEPMGAGRNVYKRLARHAGTLRDDRFFNGVRPPNMLPAL